MKLLFMTIAFGLAAACGLGTISAYWLTGAMAAAYISAILEESDTVPGGDFKRLQGKDFDKSELNIKRKTGVRLLFCGFVFGAFYLVSKVL